MQDKQTTANEQGNPNLTNAKVFNARNMKAGIPQQMYILLLFLNIFALVLAIKFFSILSVLAFIVFVLLTVIPMYIIHSEDPDAHIVWRRVIFSSGNLNNSKTTQRKVVFIKLSSHKG
ncbi:hypothetical protein CSB66_5041 [Enterobacter hormaechei]|jgi:hypothetical protein|nr:MULTISPECIES: hypothetical protein [Enterobacterales]EKV3090251.1 hypothetical protein [Pseudomonas aeruginosa]EWE59306.1 hypothetical protein L443_05597 [Klebsiella pneumoniae BIDMC 14]KDH43167.1 hypothetical protein AE55_05617 [Klebsiella pneumoniae BWH 47]KDI46544.1 hypothetical protein AE80_05133 [Klebsiella pneumoniae CHS 24]KDJ42790.1 hypothetical protein AE99_05295 [Klebsiella pneumoniae CHS 43]KDJ62991.1 hypothetical protein AF04_05308 [Klebsiella pneumoniae CHS 48]KDJ63046.1 hypo